MDDYTDQNDQKNDDDTGHETEEEAFKNFIQTYLMCALCTKIINVPVDLTCRHTFCLKCVGTWLDEHQECPTCSEPMSRSSIIETKKSYTGLLDNLSCLSSDTRDALINPLIVSNLKNRISLLELQNASLGRILDNMKLELTKFESGIVKLNDELAFLVNLSDVDAPIDTIQNKRMTSLQEDNLKLQNKNDELTSQLEKLDFFENEYPKLMEAYKSLVGDNKTIINEVSTIREELDQVKESKLKLATNNWHMRQELIQIKEQPKTKLTTETISKGLIRQKSFSDDFLSNLDEDNKNHEKENEKRKQKQKEKHKNILKP